MLIRNGQLKIGLRFFGLTKISITCYSVMVFGIFDAVKTKDSMLGTKFQLLSMVLSMYGVAFPEMEYI